MFVLLHLLLFYNFIIWTHCYYADGTADRMKGKITKLASELVIDAISKIQSVQYIRHDLHKDIPFQYGNILYQMRYRHRKMFKIYTKVLHDIEVESGDEDQFINALAEVDSLHHEIFNFVNMIQMHDANLHLDKTRPGYDLFFRRNYVMAPVWLGLVDTMKNNENTDPPEHSTPPSEENNQTQTSKRKNGVWHYAVPTN